MSGNRGAFTTTISWEESGEEIETDVRVLYSYSKGYRGDYYQPPEGDSVEILKITPSDSGIQIPERFYEDTDLLDECFQDWRAGEDDIAEWRAQSRRDDMLMERLATPTKESGNDHA